MSGDGRSQPFSADELEIGVGDDISQPPKMFCGSFYQNWPKELLEAGKRRLASDTARHTTSPEVKDLHTESAALKEVVAELILENRLLIKGMIGGEALSVIGPRKMSSGDGERANGRDVAFDDVFCQCCHFSSS